jgi:hypothetical protein
MSGATVIIERLARLTPLGIRFWDEAAHAVVTDGLVVEVYPRGEPLRRVAARPNRIGTFVGPSLPGARDVPMEFGDGSDEFWRQVQVRPYVIEVRDTRGQYQPFRLELSLPARGPAVPACLPPTSPPTEVVPLFPTAARSVPAGMAVVRADLQTPVAGRGGPGPASWAVLEVQVGTMPPVRGIADREGRVAVIVPYPEPVPGPARPASPPFAAGASLRAQEWPVRLDLFYEPEHPAPDLPELCRALAQAPAFAWSDPAGTHPLGRHVLRYGEELIVRSVLVTPAASPP